MNLRDKIKHSQDVIKKALNNYDRVGLACSFGKESLVNLYLALNIRHDIDVFYVLTPWKHQETIDFKNKIVKTWELNYHEYGYSEPQGKEFDEGSDPEKCCNFYKVEPFKVAIEDLNLDCWIRGIRSGEGRTRGEYKEFEPWYDIDVCSPLLAWSELDIWKYSALYGIPQNPLYKSGLRSLGCKPCTSMIDDSEDERLGRWKGTVKEGGECGIHIVKR